MNKNDWYQIEIEVLKDIDDLSGENLCRIISLIFNHLDIQYIVVDDLDGPFGIDVLKHQSPKILSLKQFNRIFHKISQFDCGYFHLFSSKDGACYFVSRDDLIHDSVLYTNAVVSICGGTYFIIYSDNIGVMESLKKLYPDVKIERKKVDKLVFCT